jgi:hypothetical protein
MSEISVVVVGSTSISSVVGNGDTYVFKTRNHNWLKFSRVIGSLSLLGLREEAEAFLTFVLANTDPTLSKDSRPYWKAAAMPLDKPPSG